jgi:hypothetical protein
VTKFFINKHFETVVRLGPNCDFLNKKCQIIIFSLLKSKGNITLGFLDDYINKWYHVEFVLTMKSIRSAQKLFHC